MKTLRVTNRDGFRRWLVKHHDKEREIWLVFYKKHTGKANIPLEEAIEEAICFGWIDSLIKRIDEDKYARKFTPRKEKSSWNEVNQKRAKKMIKAGLMTGAGLAKLKSGVTAPPRPVSAEIPADLKKAIAADKQAKKYFATLTPRYINMCLSWINAAKRDETRQRRIQEFVKLTARNERIGMK